METIFAYGHRIFGERVLPLLILLVAVYLFITWRPGSRPGTVARIFAILVDWQVTLGLIYLIYKFVVGPPPYYFSPLFWLHPILGFAAAYIAHRAIEPKGLFSGWGRWAPMASLVLLLLIVAINIVLIKRVPAFSAGI